MACETFLSANGTLECCPDGFTGKTDILSFVGHSCPISIAMERTLHSIAFVGTMVLCVKHFVAIKHQTVAFKRAKARRARRGKPLKWYEYPPLILLVISLGIGITSMIIASSFKVINVIPHQVGVDIPVSIAFILQGPVGFLCSTIHELRSFELVTRGSGMNKQEVDRIVHFLQTRYYSFISIYALLTCSAISFSISLGQIDPSTSPMRYLLVIRNLSFVVYNLCMIYINTQVVKQVRGVVENMSKAPESAETARAKKVISFLGEAANQKKKMAKVVGTMYVVFSIPPLWPFQTVPVALTIIMASFTKTHPVNNYLPNKKDKGSVDPSNSKTGASTAMSSHQSSAS